VIIKPSGSELLSYLKKRLPARLVDKVSFEGGKICSLVVGKDALYDVAEFLNSEFLCENAFVRVDNLVAHQEADEFIISYFLWTKNFEHCLKLKTVLSCLGLKNDALIRLISVGSIWPQALSFELELGDLFGIQFFKKPKWDLISKNKRVFLKDDFEGFPLRKNYD
jgi:NADH:ubiquinone oxidoreductase subunit C